MNYVGAVELQGPNKLFSTNGTDEYDVYDGFNYSIGHIWCGQQGKTLQTGKDKEVVGEKPLIHTHPDSKIETTTIPYARPFGGGELMGDFNIGSKHLVSDGNPGIGGIDFSMYSDFTVFPGQEMTYPLYGQNVLFWRNPQKEHNNIPPTLNIHVRYCDTAQKEIATRKIKLDERDTLENQTNWLSAAEAEYKSNTVA